MRRLGRHVVLALVLVFTAAQNIEGVFDANGTTYIKLGQVTPEHCAQHRNGPILAVELIKALNGGLGFAVGFDELSYVSFDLVSIVIPATIYGTPDYESHHQNAVLDLIAEGVDFFVGSCSHASEFERDLIDSNGLAVIAQVGPDQFYIDSMANNNTHVIGAHLSSYKYTEPTIKLAAAQGAETVAIAGRLQSLFFETTCSNARDFAIQNGMTVVLFEQYDHATEAKGRDLTYQRELATRIMQSQPDIVIGCVGGGMEEEVPTWMSVFREGQFAPKAVWLTSTTWGMPRKLETENNSTDGSYLIGSGQWHTTMGYTDDLAGSVNSFLQLFQERFGIEATYDGVASYSIVWMYMKAIQKLYAFEEGVSPGPSMFAGEKYDEAVRSLLMLNERESLYGPISFDKVLQRNVGRGPATSQMKRLSVPKDDGSILDDVCITPLNIATGLLRYPSPGAETCLVDSTSGKGEVAVFTAEKCLLCDKCEICSNKYQHIVSACDDSGERSIAYAWEFHRQCSPFVAKPANRQVECEYIPSSSDMGVALVVVPSITIGVLLLLGVLIMVPRREAAMEYLDTNARLLTIIVLLGLVLLNISLLMLSGEPNDDSCRWEVLGMMMGVALALVFTAQSLIYVNENQKKAKDFSLSSFAAFILKPITLFAAVLLVSGIAAGLEGPSSGHLLDTAHSHTGVPQHKCNWGDEANTWFTILVFLDILLLGYLIYSSFNMNFGRSGIASRNVIKRQRRVMCITALWTLLAIAAGISYLQLDSDARSDMALMKLIICECFVYAFVAYVAYDVKTMFRSEAKERTYSVVYDPIDEAVVKTVVEIFKKDDMKCSNDTGKTMNSVKLHQLNAQEAALNLIESSGVIFFMSPTSATSGKVRDLVYLADNVRKPIFPVALSSFHSLSEKMDAGVEMIVGPIQWTFLKNFDKSSIEIDLESLGNNLFKILDQYEQGADVESGLNSESGDAVGEKMKTLYRRSSTRFVEEGIQSSMPARAGIEKDGKVEGGDVFISWAHVDKQLAKLVWESLKESGLTCWIDFALEPGHTWRSEIANAIKKSNSVLFLATETAMKSKYCYDELNFARKLNKPVLPIFVNGATTLNSPRIGALLKETIGFTASFDLSEESEAIDQVLANQIAHQVQFDVSKQLAEAPKSDELDI